MGIAALPDDHVGGWGVDDVPAVRGLDFRNDVGTGCEIADPDFPLAVGGENAVGREGGRADHAVQADLAARRRGHAELSTGQDLARLTIPFLDNQFALGLVFERQADSSALFDLNSLALRVDDESGRGLDLGDDHALAGFQSLNADFALFISAVNAVAVPDQGAVRVHDLKFGVLEGDGGIGRAHLPNKKIAVRHIVEANGDNALLPVVRNEHGFGGIDD